MNGKSIFLSNNKGGYFMQGEDCFSQYQGLFSFLEHEWELYKTLDYVSGLKRAYYEHNTLVCELSDSSTFIDLDFRRIHDFNEEGRIYNIQAGKKIITIEYCKYEDNSLKKINERMFIAISGAESATPIREWIHKNYSHDQKRGIRSSFYVFRALKIETGTKKISIGFGRTKREAEKNAKAKIKEMHHPISPESALNNLVVGLRHKKIDVKGIFAGLPWFYQLWGRDENISLIGLIEQKKYEEAKRIIIRNLNSIGHDGRLPNRWPQSELGSADSTGWLYKRIHEFLVVLERENILGKFFSKKDLEKIYKILEHSIWETRKNLLVEGLIHNNDFETWMDTHGPEGSDGRKGARVEIQALHLSMYALAEHLSKILSSRLTPNYEKMEKEMIEHVHEKMMRANILCDGYTGETDFTVRPNVFLAYYVYPELLSEGDWKATFDKVLEECWLPWGGLSTISKHNPLYRDRHTGISNESYHRGDSWYFINNIAAITMHRLDRYYYKNKIDKIKEASLKNMNDLGFTGQCSELSSAAEQTGEGCLAQAWSAATLIELMRLK